MSRARVTRPRISGMLRQPSQSSTVSWPTIEISGLMRTICGTCESSSSSSSSCSASSSSSSSPGGCGAKPATNSRRLSCTCGAASPTPWYSFIVSNMSSMSCWISGVRISDGCSARAFARRTGCPMRAIFKIDICELYAGQSTVPTTEPPYRHCPQCGGVLEQRLLKAGDPSRLLCTRCGFIFYLDPKVAVGTIVRTADDRIVLVRRAIEPGYGLWVFPGGYVDRGEEITTAARREAREEAGLEIRLDGLINIYSYPGRPIVIVVYRAAVVSGELTIDDESLEA